MFINVVIYLVLNRLCSIVHNFPTILLNKLFVLSRCKLQDYNLFEKLFYSLSATVFVFDLFSIALINLYNERLKTNNVLLECMFNKYLI